jgi:hypothetical protein
MKSMTSTGIAIAVERAYLASGTFQWAREAAVNSIQAGATKILFGVEWQAVTQHHVYRRTIVDNGIGIPAPQMPAFLNKYGGSGRSIGDITGNYGVGFKTSVLPWNPQGVVVISVNGSPENSLSPVNMLWLRKEINEGGVPDYGARELLLEFFDSVGETDDDMLEDWVSSFGQYDDSTTVLPLSLLRQNGYPTEFEGIDWFKVVPDSILESGHGTVIVLLGKKLNQDTIKGDHEGDRHEDASKYGLARYLNTRIYTMPEDVEILVTHLGSDTKGGNWGDRNRWPREPKGPGIGNRRITGLLGYLERLGNADENSADKAEYKWAKTEIKGSSVSVEVETYLFPFKAQSPHSTGGDNAYTSTVSPSLPLIGITRKCHEDIPNLEETFDVRMGTEGKEALYPWLNIEAVRRRLVLILHPEDTNEAQVFPDHTRRTLLYKDRIKGGTPLPESEWAELYLNGARPGFITEEIKNYYVKLSESNNPDVEKAFVEKLNQFFPFMLTPVTEHRRGKKYDDHEVLNPHPHRGGGGYRLPSVLAKGREHSVNRGLVMVTIDEVVSDPYPIYLAFDTGLPVGHLNVSHSYIEAAWAMCLLKLKTDGVEDDKLDSYRNTFHQQVRVHVALALTHIWAFLKTGNNMKYKAEMTSKGALAAIVAGLRHLQQAAQGPFGTIKVGKAKI